jgi:hypothetical protein
MPLNLFAGVPVTDFAASLPWYERLLGRAPTFMATETEGVWELDEHRWLVVEQRPEHAGHAIPTLMVDDLEAQVAAVASRGLDPWKDETYDNGVRKVTYRDRDGNEIGFGQSWDAPAGGPA